MKSWIAEPSRRNSGLDTTQAGCLLWPCFSTFDTMSPVSGGTVDLLTTINGPSIASAIELADLRLVDVDHRNVVAQVGQAGRGGQAHVTRADHGDLAHSAGIISTRLRKPR